MITEITNKRDIPTTEKATHKNGDHEEESF